MQDELDDEIEINSDDQVDLSQIKGDSKGLNKKNHANIYLLIDEIYQSIYIETLIIKQHFIISQYATKAKEQMAESNHQVQQLILSINSQQVRNMSRSSIKGGIVNLYKEKLISNLNKDELKGLQREHSLQFQLKQKIRE